MTPTFDPLAPLAQLLSATRHAMVDRLLAGAALMTAALLPVLWWRASEVGWHPQLQVQAVVFAVTIALALARRRLPLALKVGVMLAATATVGVSGVFSLGMAGTGYFWLLLTAAFVAVFVSLAAGMAALAAAAALMAAAGYGFVSGALVLPIDLDRHTVSASGWAYFIAVLTVVPMVVLYAFGGMQRHLLQLLDTLQAQRSQLAEQHEAMQRLAMHDPLTGLPQAHVARDRLEVALRAAQRRFGRVGYLFIDLDGFKAVNDGHGHEAGDGVLREVAQRLSTAVRGEDTVARIGGDEFALIVGHVVDEVDTLQIASQIRQALAEPVRLDGHSFEVGASIGIAIYPDHAQDADGLRRQADAAMYRAKQAGGRRAAMADARMPADATVPAAVARPAGARAQRVPGL